MSDARFVSMIEIILLAIIAIGAMIMAGLSIKNKDASGAAAWSGLMMAIVNVIKEGRSSRTIDRMAATAAESPARDPKAKAAATGKSNDPIHQVTDGA